jgi:error-prone DNA polymerase
MTGFAELVAASNYSFLHGASHPADLVGQAIAHRYTAIGIADRNTVAGVVRAYSALKEAPDKARDALLKAKQLQGQPAELTREEEASCRTDLRLLVGARLVFTDGTPDIVAYPTTRKGWGRLTRLLTVGNMRAVKGNCILHFADLIDHAQEQLFIVLPESTATPQERHKARVEYDHRDERGFSDAVGYGQLSSSGEAKLEDIKPHLTLLPPPPPRDLADTLTRINRHAPGCVWLGVTMPHQGPDRRRLAKLKRIAADADVPLLATQDALYATPAQRPLHDVLTCIRLGCTLAEAGTRLHANAERHLKSPEQLARLFRTAPQAIDETVRFVSRIGFTLDQLCYEYPNEPVPSGWDAQTWLEHLVWQLALDRYGERVPEKALALMHEEFTLIRKCGYAPYFLTVHDIVRFARSYDPPILCQGRGSAANSIVCFLLGVTSVDPMQYDLLFSRFVSEERSEPPDIDVDFEHERRELVMQYIYKRYGRHRASIAATVIHYRSRSAVREVAKVLGLSEDISNRLVSTVWGSFSTELEERRFIDAGYDLRNPEIARLRMLVDQLLEAPFPRHLSQHVGGFVLTQDRLDETVPIHNGAMADRSFIEWDKDDIDALRLMKVDVLALGMLTCIHKAFDLMRRHDLGDHTLEVDLGANDPEVFEMLQRGDSVGVFQVESRAQMNMLPRLKPVSLYDLTVQVAIVRPGPIQGDMVHPYLRRRMGIDKAEFPSPKPPHDPDELKNLLGLTFGVPLFQEQAMKLAIVAAEFTPSEANQLRRAMATFRHVGGIDKFRDKMIGGMVRRGYRQEFAERCYRQIEGFGSYGFPESHALSFARLVYVSSWIKCHHPAVFACALLNSQPMGFYAPAQIVRDAREHEVEVRGVDVAASDWDNSLERAADGGHALRIGFRQIDSFREAWGASIMAARADGPFTDIEALARRAKLPQRALKLLADADALRTLAGSRRDALWDVRRTPDADLPLFAAARAGELGVEPAMALPAMHAAEHVALDYQTKRLSVNSHPMAHLRATLAREGVFSCRDAAAEKGGTRARVAGIVLVRQRPGNGKAIFVTLEDETGIANLLIWARTFEAQRRPIMAARLMLVEGEVQRSPEGVVHIIVSNAEDRSTLLDTLSDGGAPTAPVQMDRYAPPYPDGCGNYGHPRDARVLPKSRDFH